MESQKVSNEAVCKVCGSISHRTFSTLVLNKYEVSYFKCPECEFIQTEDPYWLNEAYSSAITSLDIGLISRNLEALPFVRTIIKLFFDSQKEFLDYGGGYGMFVRLLRDKGFRYYRYDTYCENLFAKHFDLEDATAPDKFELLTAFEVFEHLADPQAELKKMLQYSKNIFFSTTIYPQNVDLLKWWYLIPETGQHVSLYSRKSLETLAKQHGKHYYSFNGNYHLFTERKVSDRLFQLCFNRRFQTLFNRIKKDPPSLLPIDFNRISSLKMQTNS